jgi:quercetin dioxygenase-like cupin family protein
MDCYSWNDIPEELVDPLWSRQMIHMPSMTILRLRFKKGGSLSRHHHIHEQVTMVTEGSIRIEVDGEEFRLVPGDVLRIPSNAMHFLEALEDSAATDVFTPAREDLKKPAEKR